MGVTVVRRFKSIIGCKHSATLYVAFRSIHNSVEDRPYRYEKRPWPSENTWKVPLLSEIVVTPVGSARATDSTQFVNQSRRQCGPIMSCAVRWRYLLCRARLCQDRFPAIYSWKEMLSNSPPSQGICGWSSHLLSTNVELFWAWGAKISIFFEPVMSFWRLWCQWPTVIVISTTFSYSAQKMFGRQGWAKGEKVPGTTNRQDHISRIIWTDAQKHAE